MMINIKTSKKTILQYISIFLLFFAIIIIIFNSKNYINSTFKGILVWATIVLPALVPFFFITKALIYFPQVYQITNKFSKITNKLFNCNGICGYIFFMGIISGYPVGAKLISEFFGNNYIDEGQAHRLVALCSTSGPMFVIGSVGVGLLCNAMCGVVIFVSHGLASVLNGIIFRRFKAKNYLPKKNIFSMPQNATKNILNEIMLNTIMSSLMVGGFIAISFTLIEMLLNTNVLLPISAVFNQIFGIFGVNGTGQAFSCGIVEVTRGCVELAGLKLSLTASTLLCGALISFGGISIHLQSMVFLKDCKIKYGYFLLTKIIHTLITIIISLILCTLLF